MTEFKQIGVVEILRDRVYALDPRTTDPLPTRVFVEAGEYAILSDGFTTFWKMRGHLTTNSIRRGDGIFIMTGDDSYVDIEVEFTSKFFGLDEWAEMRDDEIAREGHPEQRLSFKLDVQASIQEGKLVTDVDYTALNEQAKILYVDAFTVGRRHGIDEENSRHAREAAEKSLKVARSLIVLVQAETPSDRMSRQIAGQASYILYTMCPVTYSPSLYQIRDAIKRGTIEDLSTAVDMIDADLEALKLRPMKEAHVA